MERIVPGDLVQIVKPTLCCGQHANNLGLIKKVVDVLPYRKGHCIYCRAIVKSSAVRFVGSNHLTPSSGMDIRRVKKIKPLTDDEINEEQKEIENENTLCNTR